MNRVVCLLAVLAFAAACSTGTDRSVGYLEALAPIARDVNFALVGLGETLDRHYESDLLRSTALGDVRIGRDLAIAYDRTTRLEPPPDLRSDHEEYLVLLSAARELAASIDAAAADGDLASAVVAATEMEITAGLAFVDLTARTCAAVSFDRRLCDRGAGLDAYGSALLTEMQRLAAAYLPLMRPAPAGLKTEEAGAYRSTADAEAAATLDRAAGSIAAHDPPPDLTADHQLLLDSLQAVADSHRGGPGESPVLLCTAATGLSEAAEALTSVVFGDDDLGCEP